MYNFEVNVQICILGLHFSIIWIRDRLNCNDNYSSSFDDQKIIPFIFISLIYCHSLIYTLIILFSIIISLFIIFTKLI